MLRFFSMERRMAALFVLALALIGWQASRIQPLGPLPLSLAWTGGEQAFPIAAPSWGEPLVLPAGIPARYQLLRQHSSLWPGVTAPEGCEAFIRTSASVWVRRGLDPGLLPGPVTTDQDTLRYSAQDFLDDDDGDGDTLDAGELTRSGPGAEVQVFCPPPMSGDALP
jgi:hypothetical protein